MKIYIIGLIIISFAMLYLYVYYDRENKKELEKISYLEKKQEIKEKKLALIRSKTQPCMITELDTPRTCYMDSQYKCSWNEAGERCDSK